MNTSSIANGMWCSASSITTSWTSLAGTSGIWTFLMINSRPQTAMTASTPSIPALARLLDRVGHHLAVADRALGNGVRGQPDSGHPDEPGGAAVLDLHDLDGAGADIEPETIGAPAQSLQDVQHVISPVESVV